MQPVESTNQSEKIKALAPLPEQEISGEVLVEKYAKGQERTVEDVRRRVARALATGRARGEARAVGGEVPRRAGARLHPRGPHQFRRRHDAHRDADQLLRAAGRGLDHRGRRRPARDLHRARRSRGDDAPRRRRRLRLLVDPAAGRARARHDVARERAGVVHARVRPLVRDGRVRGLAPRRADGRAPLRPSRRRGLHPRQGQGRAHQLQHLGRRDRRVHARGREGRRLRARAQGRAVARRAGSRARTGAPTASGSIARSARGACGTRSCARPTTTPSRACSSSTA